MIYRTRKLIKPTDLNSRGTLFGGQLLKWIDEEAAIYAMCQTKSREVVTKYISDIDFKYPPQVGDIIEIGIELVRIGITSLTLKCSVRDKESKKEILTIDSMVFVKLDVNGKPEKIIKYE